MLLRLDLPIVLALLAFPSLALAETNQADPKTPSKESSKAKPTAEDRWDSEKRQAALRVQLFLDAKGFGPGKIDGYWGGFSEKAAQRWNASGNDNPVVIKEDGSLDLKKANDLPFPGDLLTSYKITAADKDLLGSIPEEPGEKAKLDNLPYENLMEVVAEKFHVDPDFVREVNGLASDGDLKVGMELRVPNVSEPFDIKIPMELASAAEKQDEKSEPEKEEETGKKEAPDSEMTVLREQRVVEVRKAGKLIHSFPISPGASNNQSPAGDWEVSVVSWMPEFRWDKSMLEDGTRSDDSHLLPPGPNNPVGIVWVGLTADGIGLHGTPFPDAIGRNSSHGCIRLANWDALKLAQAVAVGTKVTIK